MEVDLTSKIRELYKKLKKIFIGNLHTHQILLEEELSYNHVFTVLQ